MCRKFTSRYRKIMALANQCAIEWNHEYIGTEHILMGLIREGSGIGFYVLKNLNANITREDIRNIIEIGPEIVLATKLSQTPRSRRVIESAIKIAKEMNYKYVGTEHILLGIVEDGDNVAAQILLNKGITKEKIKAEILLLLGVKVDDIKVDDIKTCTNCIHSRACPINLETISSHLNTETIKMMLGVENMLRVIEEIKQLFGNRCKNFERKS